MNHTHINCTSCGEELTDKNWSNSWKKVNRTQCKACSKNYNDSSNDNRMWVDGEYIKTSHPLHKPGRYNSFGEAAFKALQKGNATSNGYVYAMRNSAWPEWIKIGKAVDVHDRIKGYQTGSPMRDYELIGYAEFTDYNGAEIKAHNFAEKLGERKNEWFKITDDEAMRAIRSVA